jgi:hypothetical protein
MTCNYTGMLFKCLPQIFRPIWRERHTLLAPSLNRVFGPAVQSTSLYTPINHKTNPTQTTGDTGNGPCRYVRIPCTSTFMHLHSLTEEEKPIKGV